MRKIGIIALPLLCAVGFAMADGMEKAEATAQTETAAVPAGATAHHRMARREVKRLPRGDLRQCLELKTDAAIIRCSETGRKHKR
jgi:hypothetical protein